MADTPAARFLADAWAPTEVSDADGRTLIVRRLGALDKLRLFKAIGPYLSQNEPYLGMAMLAYSVAEIDGVPIPAPANEAQLEGLISRLGDAGLSAVGRTLSGGSIRDEREASAHSGN
jgi:hypothetical protein